MPLVAITREVSPSINDCQLSFHERQPIDLAKAFAQHQAYGDRLRELDAEVISLPSEPDFPDAVFVEDPAVVVDEVAIITNMGVSTRRPEAKSLAQALANYRPIKCIVEPGTLDGGDVLRIGRTLFVGQSQRTNQEGFNQLQELLRPYDYRVHPVEVRGCLHLKSACSYIGNNTILLNRSWLEIEPLREFVLLDVHEDEPNGANALSLNHTVILPASFPKTRALLEQLGFSVRSIDLAELQKAEAGVTCCSLILQGSLAQA